MEQAGHAEGQSCGGDKGQATDQLRPEIEPIWTHWHRWIQTTTKYIP